MSRPRTKLVCTIGPASVDKARELVDAGVSVARVNFSHGTPDDQKQAVHAIRGAAHHARRSVAVMVDLPGPKIRLGELPPAGLELETGATFELHTNRPTLADEVRAGDRILLADGAVELVVLPDEPGEPEEPTQPQEPTQPPTDQPTEPTEPPTDQPTEPTQPQEPTDQPTEPTPTQPPTDQPTQQAQPPTDELTPDTVAEGTSTTSALSATPDDAMTRADAATGEDTSGHAVDSPADPAIQPSAPGASARPVRTQVVRGGLVRSRAGVNVPIDRLSAEALTAQDRAAVPRALELRADLIAQSFVRTADDVRALRALLPADGPLVVAKIETRAAIDNFDEIAGAADGVMIARGDLGVDIPLAEVPLVQKELIQRAMMLGRFTIVATQMLESMTSAARPTRAEVSDVANAVLDGADAVMLSAETAIGAHPIEAARAMLEICAVTEAGSADLPQVLRPPPAPPTDDPTAICRAAVAVADAYPATDAIWCFTRSGRTADLLAQLRPRVPIVAFTVSAVVARRLAVRRSVVPVVLSPGPANQPLVERMAVAARAQRLIAEGQASVVFVTTSAQAGGVNRLELAAV